MSLLDADILDKIDEKGLHVLFRSVFDGGPSVYIRKGDGEYKEVNYWITPHAYWLDSSDGVTRDDNVKLAELDDSMMVYDLNTYTPEEVINNFHISLGNAIYQDQYYGCVLKAKKCKYYPYYGETRHKAAIRQWDDDSPEVFVEVVAVEYVEHNKSMKFHSINRMMLYCRPVFFDGPEPPIKVEQDYEYIGSDRNF